MKKKQIVTIIRRSCLTGNAMWIYQGASQESARKKYLQACKREIHRMRYLCGLMVARRGRNISRLLKDCTQQLSTASKLLPEQRAAIKSMQMIARQNVTCRSELYNHILEAHRRRQEEDEIRRSMRV